MYHERIDDQDMLRVVEGARDTFDERFRDLHSWRFGWQTGGSV